MDPQETADVADSTLNFSKLSSVSESKPSIPGYELAEKLGQGAFGAAYRAVQARTGQSVAVKVLTRVSSTFREEVDKLSRVSDHPHIVTLVDADLDHSPHYLVTPLLQGSLADEVPSRPEDAELEKVEVWFKELAVALEYIHSRGILHCDLKPANILIGQEGYVRLTDFGQAALQDHDESRLGSFWYMPWQQTEGRLPEVRWDLYALGATIYTLLSGRPPRSTQQSRESLRSHSTVSEKLEEYRRFIRTSPLIPLRDLNPRVDEELAAIVEHCLDTEHGYSHAAEVLADLDRRDKKLPLAARPFSYLYLLKRFIARHRLSFAVGVIAVSILLTGLGISSYQVYQAKKARSLLIQQQYEQGRSLLKEGQVTGLVWLLRAYELEQREEFRQALLGALAQQWQVSRPFLYSLRTSTAPSPSGHFVVWRNQKQNLERMNVDLRSGEILPLPPGLLGSDRDQKDKVRYRLDGVELDPHQGAGGPATWRIRSTDSLQPGEQGGSLAILVRPDIVWRVQRSEAGLRVLDREDRLVRDIRRPGQTPVQPTFSRQGDLAVSWEDNRVDWYRPDGETVVDRDFYGDIFCFSDDGRYLAASDGVSKLRVWNREGERVAQFQLSAPANELCFSQDSKLLVVAARDGLVHGYRVDEERRAWPPLALQNPARWVYVQGNGKVVTMSDVVTVWESPESLDSSLREPEELSREVARRTGWIFDEKSAQIRTLSREEYLKLFRS